LHSSDKQGQIVSHVVRIQGIGFCFAKNFVDRGTVESSEGLLRVIFEKKEDPCSSTIIFSPLLILASKRIWDSGVVV